MGELAGSRLRFAARRRWRNMIRRWDPDIGRNQPYDGPASLRSSTRRSPIAFGDGRWFDEAAHRPRFPQFGNTAIAGSLHPAAHGEHRHFGTGSLRKRYRFITALCAGDLEGTYSSRSDARRRSTPSSRHRPSGSLGKERRSGVAWHASTATQLSASASSRTEMVRGCRRRNKSPVSRWSLARRASGVPDAAKYRYDEHLGLAHGDLQADEPATPAGNRYFCCLSAT